MLVGAGIGVTPFASILKHIKHIIKNQNSYGKAPIDKVYQLIPAFPYFLVTAQRYFYWICRDKNSFEWFSKMLAALEGENVNSFLEINIFLTGGLAPDEIRDGIFI